LKEALGEGFVLACVVQRPMLWCSMDYWLIS